MPGSPEVPETKRAFEELSQLILRQQHLEGRCAILVKQHAFMKQKNTEDSERPSELDKIEKELEVLLKRKEELLQHKDKIINIKRQKTASKDGHDVSCKTEDVFYISPAPSQPAPQVITEVEALPSFPSQIQCPLCQKFITTKIYHRVGSTTWLLCLITVIIGCAAGCCFIPFCLEAAKDLEHRCPECQKQIHVIKRL